MVNILKYRKVKGRKALTYPNIPSSIAPVSHNESLPVPSPPRNVRYAKLSFSKQCLCNISLTICFINFLLFQSEILDEISSCEESATDTGHQSTDEGYAFATSTRPHFSNKTELDDLIRDLGLTKSGAELLASRLGEWNLLGKDCKSTAYRKRHAQFSVYFTVDGNLCYCKDANGLFVAIGIEHIPSQWRLFIDSSSRSLKAVLLHNGNKHPSIPVAYSIQMSETYEKIQHLLNRILYDIFNWYVCGDLKMLGFLLGLQGGFTKFSFFLCLWDSRANSEHYVKVKWRPREDLTPGKHNVIQNALVAREKILLPPLHIKLGLAKQFVKALDVESKAFKEIRQMFPKLSDAKVKGGIFVGPQIAKMLKSETLENKMSFKEKEAWQSFRGVVEGFLVNRKDPNYRELVARLIGNFQNMGCRMSLKLHFLCSHLGFFQDNLGDFSEEHGERFHQDIEPMERRYQGRWDSAMMGDYVWCLMRHDTSAHKRKARSAIHF